MNFHFNLLSYYVDYYNKTHIRNHEMSINPDPQTTFDSFFTNLIYILIFL